MNNFPVFDQVRSQELSSHRKQFQLPQSRCIVKISKALLILRPTPLDCLQQSWITNITCIAHSGTVVHERADVHYKETHHKLGVTAHTVDLNKLLARTEAHPTTSRTCWWNLNLESTITPRSRSDWTDFNSAPSKMVQSCKMVNYDFCIFLSIITTLDKNIEGSIYVHAFSESSISMIIT